MQSSDDEHRNGAKRAIILLRRRRRPRQLNIDTGHSTLPLTCTPPSKNGKIRQMSSDPSPPARQRRSVGHLAPVLATTRPVIGVRQTLLAQCAQNDQHRQADRGATTTGRRAATSDHDPKA